MSNIFDNTNLLSQLARIVGKDWQKLGRLLSVNDNVLDAIDADYNDMEEKAYRMFCAWKNQQKSPTLDDLANAMYQIYRIDKLDFISGIKEFLNKTSENEEKKNIINALKTHYLEIYKTTEQLVHNMITPIDVELSDKFVELTLVDANEVEKDAVNNSEREYFLQKHWSYERIKLQEVLSKNPSLLLISGIAGIGKTIFLKKCLLDWAKGSIWKSIDLVFFLECRQLNLIENIGSVDELLNYFYKDFVKGFSISSHLSTLFVVDGLDEFFWLDELLKQDLKSLSQYPIVKALADTLNFDKAKCIIAGRVGVISKYKCKVKNQKDKLIIQIMGFNNDGINDYIEKNTNKNQIESVNNVLEESYAAKAMASVPFYLAVMCAIITSTSKKYYSFNTMTELYCCIFIYFLQKHINKNEEPIWKMMERTSVKENIHRICKIAFELLNQGKVVFTDSEMKQMANFDDQDDDKVFGFIEKIESHTGNRYQFVHLTLMEFCASVHAYICLTPSDIMKDKRIQSLLPMICGLTNRDSSCFINFIAKMKKSQEEHSLLLKVLNENKIFIECFFEAQPLITEEMKRSIDERKWKIYINDGKTAREVLHEKYFMDKLIEAGCKLNELNVRKKILSEDEKKLLSLCSTNVRCVSLSHPVNIDGWKPAHRVEKLWINIRDTLVSKIEFEGFLLPWIRFAEELDLYLHDDTNFIDDIFEWLCVSKFKWLVIRYRGKDFDNIKEFKVRNTNKCLTC